MKIKLTIFILFLSLSFSIGLKALVIPQSASLLSTSGTGISNNYQVNPALLLNEKNHVSFSKNIWLGDVSGQKICLISKNKTYFSFETLSVSDIELRDEIANDTPYGLSGYVQSGDVDHALAVAAKIRSGNVAKFEHESALLQCKSKIGHFLLQNISLVFVDGS